ncbi:MAG: molybdenum cofactor guanylyltransferase [Myxococcota bacterium]
MSAESDTGRGTYDTIAGVLLTGGASSRFGRDKSHLAVDGEPAAERISKLLANLFSEVLIVGGAPPATVHGRVVADEDGPQCALRGLVTALAASSRERVMVLATDIPLVSADLLLALVAWPEADAIVPEAEGRLHPLCGLYRREVVLAAARPRLVDRRLALRGLLDEVETVTFGGRDLAEVDPDGVALINVNAPEDLARIAAAGVSVELPAADSR